MMSTACFFDGLLSGRNCHASIFHSAVLDGILTVDWVKGAMVVEDDGMDSKDDSLLARMMVKASFKVTTFG